MAYDARVIQILVASPGDVSEERELISEVIYEWNYVYSRDRSVVLLPLRWETHASPEMGSSPQAVINRQVVDHCDMAIGVFWTRLGTPTEEAESGTAEEIARVGEAGKPVMLYFSQEKVSPETLDLEEYGRLKEFKRKTYPNGLVENYSSLSDFRQKLQRQLAIRIRDIIAERTPEEGGPVVDSQSIELTFAHGNPPAVLSPANVLELTKVICTDSNEIPDHTKSEIGPANSANNFTTLTMPNRGFYRELVEYYRQYALRSQLRLAVSSLSDRSVRDIYMEIRIRVRKGKISINPSELRLPYRTQSTVLASWAFGTGESAQIIQTLDRLQGQVAVEKISDDEWRMEVNIPVIQAQRTVFSNNSFVLAVDEDSQVVFDATVYSSDAPPFSLSTELEVCLRQYEVSYREILKQILPDYDDHELD